MIPVFANSAWVPVRRGLVQRGGGFPKLRLRVRYGLFIHPTVGPVLIDTGYSYAVTEGAERSLPLKLYARALQIAPDAQPVDFLARQGLRPADIKVVIVTHYHADHISGLGLFPRARVIGHGGALRAIRAAGAFANLRHGVFSELLPEDLEDRLTEVEGLPQRDGPPGGRDLFGDGSVLAVALPGHAEGHFGLWFPGVRLFYAVDTEWVKPALLPGGSPRVTASLVASDATAAADSRRFVREAEARGAAIVLCHDPAPTPFDEREGA
ncbi:MBL fold metallo-hydrolase [Falsigemmobacter faecalis]|uniref:MBL fold metallo-hydrolase n=1 Tax=Falsigemmobacter faecalis TaxID=2488730 RepID=A0A3P3DIM2_9RHOB|nr:MBL fold metallo-hydrolase [Falsigemmobacter faecalis]RRH73556.1 MBL fold metallo-hydrolase [Falsigemmobacter faecalis]